MRKGLIVLLLVTLSYGAEKPDAAFFKEFFNAFTDKAVKKEMHFICPKTIKERRSLGEKFLILDIRTKEEREQITQNLGETVSCSMNEVFADELLQKLRNSKDDIVVLCKSGNRAIPITMALRQIGINNTFTLKGGIDALVSTVGP